LEEKEDEAKEKLRKMLPGERAKLRRVIVRLDDWIEEVEEEDA
jgi:hypothetical protein